MRRAGFGATREELEALSHEDYENTVEKLLDTDHPNMMSLDMMRRYNPENSGMIAHLGGGSRWMYRMISTDSPLREKVGLFWHGIFATGLLQAVQRQAARRSDPDVLASLHGRLSYVVDRVVEKPGDDRLARQPGKPQGVDKRKLWPGTSGTVLHGGWELLRSRTSRKRPGPSPAGR